MIYLGNKSLITQPCLLIVQPCLLIVQPCLLIVQALQHKETLYVEYLVLILHISVTTASGVVYRHDGKSVHQ